MRYSRIALLPSLLALASAAPFWLPRFAKRDIVIVTVSETVTVLNGVTLYPSTTSSTEAYTTPDAVPTSSDFIVTSTTLAATHQEAVPTTTTSSSPPPPPPATTSTPPPPPTTTTTPPPPPPTTTAAPAPTEEAKSTLSDFAQQILDQHNKYRAQHSAPPLEWDEELASYAASYVTTSNSCGTHQLVHSGGPYGENLAMGYSFTGTVDAWYDEIDQYSYSNPGFSMSTGHFTQVVWKSTTKLGCAYQYCDSMWSNYVVCEYDPAGNYDGEYAENVL